MDIYDKCNAIYATWIILIFPWLSEAGTAATLFL